MSFDYQFLRNAPVKVEQREHRSKKGDVHPVCHLAINDKFEHTFESSSRVSRHLETMTPLDLEERLSGGDYFLINGELVDFRDNRYNGFTHDDETIQQLVDIVGIRELERGADPTMLPSGYSLSGQWSDHGIEIPEYQDSGDFSSVLSFSWSPFTKAVHSSFMLWRLICTNGMRGLSSFLNTKIPLVNRWEEHLDIANKQIQNKVTAKISTRLREMSAERASVAEASLIANHAYGRINDGGHLTSEERQKLERIMTIANPRLHLHKVYYSDVFSDKRIASQVPSHLTSLDVYNMATEVRTHTKETTRSTANALDKFANVVLFNDKRKNVVQEISRFSNKPKLSSFSNPETAFYALAV